MQPEWLYQISYGLSGYDKFRILIDGKRFAIVQTPGGRWFDNSGGHYGGAGYHIVDKEAVPNLRKAHGLLDTREIQQGGRAKLAQWKQLIKESDEAGKDVGIV